jgi:subtilisin family serine protease
MAAPHVAGVVALLLQAQPKLTPNQVRAALVAAARDLGPEGQDPDFGAGFTDALTILERPADKPQASASPNVSAEIRDNGVNLSAPSRD